MQVEHKRPRHEAGRCALNNEELLLVQCCWNFLNSSERLPLCKDGFTPLEAHLTVTLAVIQASMLRIGRHDDGRTLFHSCPMHQVPQDRWDAFISRCQALKAKLG